MEEVDALLNEIGIDIPLSDGTFNFDESSNKKSSENSIGVGVERESKINIDESKSIEENAAEEDEDSLTLLDAPIKMGDLGDQDHSMGNSRFFDSNGAVLSTDWKARPSAARLLFQKQSALAAKKGEARRKKKMMKAEKRLRDQQNLEIERRTKKEPVSFSFQTRYNPSGKLISSADALTIRVEGLGLGYGGSGAGELLKDADLQLVAGHRYGLIGKNGVGKSSLLNAIESLAPDKTRIMHVAQEAEGNEATVIDSVVKSDTVVTEIRNKIAVLERAAVKDTSSSEDRESELRALYNELESLGAHTSESRAAMILHGLGFTPELQRAQTQTLSGGWRMRLALAQAIYCRPDLLLLDEPSNHLDLPAVLWLTNYLANWSRTSTLLVVSHDRSFLDGIATDIILMERKTLTVYRGNYSLFKRTRDEQRIDHERRYARAQDEIAHMQAFVDKWLHNRFGNNRGQVQARLKMIHRFKTPGYKEHVPKPVPLDKNTTFRFQNPKTIKGPLIQVKNVSFRYGPESHRIFDDVTMKICMGDKIAIVGSNGAGKSTLLKLACGLLDPEDGAVVRKSKAGIAVFTQHHTEQLDLSMKPLELMRNVLGTEPSTQELRRRLGAFGIGPEIAELPIVRLSGGQKSRVALAQACAHHPHVLFLDEPSNHLDIQSIDGLAKAIRSFTGAVVLVSHDEHLIRASTNALWVCDGTGTATQLHGAFDEYKGRVVKATGGS